MGARITAIEHYSGVDRIRVVVRLDARVQFVEGTANEPYRIFFDLQGTSPAPGLAPKSLVSDPTVQRIRVGQYQPGITRVVLDLAQQAPYTVSFFPNPPQLVIEVMRTASARAVKAPSPPAAAIPGSAAAPAIEPQKPLAAPAPAATHAAASIVSPPPSPAATTQPAPPAPVVSKQPAPANLAPQQSKLAERFDVGAPSKSTVASELLPAAQHGDAKAQFQLGDLYMAGRGGVTRDPRVAANWFLQAAQQGHALAAANLGVLYANGWGVQRSDADAVTWFRKAAEAGDPGGQNNLGAMYITGRGVQQDDTLGAKWVLRAAQQGTPEAEYAMGTLCANGRGVPRDDAQAVLWLQKAAAQNYPAAMVALGKMYVTGSGVPRDYRQALKLFQSANVPEAWYQIALLYQQGLGVTASDSEAVVWLMKAAERGYPEAQYAIGRLYMERDPVEAYSWFALAAASGDKDGVTAMNSMASRMTPEQLAKAQKRALDLGRRVSK